ncbi:hypothetical protein, partial [Campylobacter rectus]|uniref:hypothetical protein n=1 Tax=Campylobacter rectus TaxID=203 RepID=UPI0028DBB800
VSKLGRTLDQKNLDEAKDNVTIADKTKDVAQKQEKVAEKQVDHSKAVAKEAPLLDAVKKAYEDYAKAQSEKTIADFLSDNVRSFSTIGGMKAKIETSDDLTYQQKLVAKAKLDAWIKGLNLDLDEQLDNATKAPIQAKADANKAAAAAKFENAKKAYDDGNAGALHDHTKNKEEIKTSSGESAKAKADAASAIVALKKAKEDIAKANLNKDPDNEELKAALQKAQDELKKAQAEEKSAKTTANVENFGTVELKKVGDTNVYKSDDGKYTVDLGNDKVTDGKTLAVGRGSYQLYEIDENSTDAGAPKHTNKTVLYSHDKGGSVYKNGVEQFSFLSKDGNAVAALKAGGKGFILKPGVKTDYDTMSKANFNDADGKFEIGGADQKAYQIETEKNPSPHNPDNPQYSVTKIKNFEGRDYNFKDKPILDGDFKITGTKDLKDDLKIPLINGKIYAGRVGDYHINTDSDNNLKSLTDEVTGTYNFDADEKVESITKFGYTYNLKGGHKTLADAIALATGAQNALNKASSTVVNNYTNDVFRLDNDGKATSVQLYNKNELTVRDLTPFKPYTINTLKISKIKFASGEEFKLAGDHTYGNVRNYEKVAGKFLLKHGNEYKNSVYEDGTHKFTVTDAGENKYTLTETKDGNTVSVEKFRDGITKTVDANGVTLSGTESNDSDTITVKDGQTTVDASGDAKNVGIDNINAGKVSFNSVEEVRVNSNTALDKKGLDVLNKAADKIVLDNSLTLKNADGGLLDLTKVINYNNNLTVNVANNAKADTIKFGAKIAGDKLNINGFKKDDGDKVDFSAFGLGKDNFVNDAVADNAGAELKGGKVYKANVSANGSVGDLFGAGKAFATVQAKAKSIVLAKTATDTKAYLVNDANGNGTIEANELKLLGTFNGDVGDLSADNIA